MIFVRTQSFPKIFPVGITKEINLLFYYIIKDSRIHTYMFKMNNKLANNIITISIILITCLMIFGVMRLFNIKIEEGMDTQSNTTSSSRKISAGAGTTIINISNLPALSNEDKTSDNVEFPTEMPTTIPPTPSVKNIYTEPPILTPTIPVKTPSIVNKANINPSVSDIQ
jgi:hypothetical protein